MIAYNNFKSDFRTVVKAFVRKRKPYTNLIRYNKRKRLLGTYENATGDSTNDFDYVEEEDIKWGHGSGNGIGYRVFVNKNKVWAWAQMGARYSNIIELKYNESPDDIKNAKDKIVNMIHKVENDYMYHTAFGWQ